MKNFASEIVKAKHDPLVGISIAELVKGEELTSFGTRIAANKKVGCHAHSKGDEWYIILAGNGVIFLADVVGETLVNQRNKTVATGDVFCIPANTAHQLVATTELDLIFLCPRSHLANDRILFPDLG